VIKKERINGRETERERTESSKMALPLVSLKSFSSRNDPIIPGVLSRQGWGMGGGRGWALALFRTVQSCSLIDGSIHNLGVIEKRTYPPPPPLCNSHLASRLSHLCVRERDNRMPLSSPRVPICNADVRNVWAAV